MDTRKNGSTISEPAVDFTRLYHPRSIAVVGATEGEGNPAAQTTRLIGVAAAKGASFYPISASRSTVQGVPAYASLTEVPGPVDVAVLQVGDPAAVIELLPDDSNAPGVPAFVIVFTSGYSELGTEAGRAAEQRLVDACRGRGIRLVGPNTNLNSLELRRHEGVLPRIGLVTQSGAQGRPLVEAEALGIEFSYWAATGNEADLEASDFFEFLAHDPETAAIAAYVEGFVSGQRLREAALAALEWDTPIALVKVGRSEIGKTLAVSHTAHLAGSDVVHDAFFEQYGITRVTDIDELLEVTTALARAPIPAVDGIVLWGISGGSVVHLADIAGTLGLSVPELGAQTQANLRKYIPDYLMVRNPVDNGGHSLMSGHGGDDLQAIIADPVTGVLICALPGNFGNMTGLIADAIEQARDTADKPIIVVWLAPLITDPGYQRLLDMGIPIFSNVRNALVGAQALVNRFRAQRDKSRFIDAARALPPIGSRMGGSSPLDESEAMDWLAERGIPTATHRAVSSPEEAAKAAEEIGFPVVLKGRGRTIAHKSELGLVRIGLSSADDVLIAANEMALGAARDSLEGYVVAAQHDGGIELIVGISHDEVLGPVVTVGAGGIQAEALRDVSVSVLPLLPERAASMLDRLRIAPLLDGWRGAAGIDREAVIKVLLDLAAIAASGEVDEVDINPLVASPDGVCALDALVLLRDKAPAGEEG